MYLFTHEVEGLEKCLSMIYWSSWCYEKNAKKALNIPKFINKVTFSIRSNSFT